MSLNFFSVNFKKDFDYYGYNYLFYEKNELNEKNLSEKDSIMAEHEKKASRSNNFYKADINNDGRTDLIIDGKYSLVVIDTGNSYVIHFIDGNGAPRYFFKEAIELPDRSTALLFRHTRMVVDGSRFKVVSGIDTLVYKFGCIVEYNEHTPYISIRKVVFYEQAACFGYCTDFKIEVNKNKECIYNVIKSQEFRDSVGKYFCTINSNQANNLMSLLTYLDVSSLKSNYNSGASDNSTVTLTVYFDDGSEKTIDDYGLRGTMGLRSVYGKFFELQKSKEWRRQ